MSLKEHPDYKKLFVSEHPLMQHKLSLLRSMNGNRMQFKALVDELTMLLVYECCSNLVLTHTTIETPICEFSAPVLADNQYVILPILRAGLGMVDGFLKLLPTARVGHLGLYRDEKSLTPKQYYFKIPPNSQEHTYFVCDPMLATGGSINHALKVLDDNGIHNKKLICLLAAPEGVKAVKHEHPDVPIYTAAIDQGLNDHGYIVPGLGDAGDRLFGTL